MPPKRLSYKNQEFDVLVRHNDLRKALATNPTQDQLAPYMSVARARANTYCRKSAALCRQMGYEYDDILQFTTCWAINFVGRYEMAGKPIHENKKLFSAYLSQRFQEFSKILAKKNRSVTPAPEYRQLQQDSTPEPKVTIESLREMVELLPQKVRKKKLSAIAKSKAYNWEVRKLAKELL